LPREQTFVSPVGHVGFVPIVLKKSDFTGERNFAAALVRSSQIHMGDRITNAISNG
jgi:hypothetical protein